MPIKYLDKTSPETTTEPVETKSSVRYLDEGEEFTGHLKNKFKEAAMEVAKPGLEVAAWVSQPTSEKLRALGEGFLRFESGLYQLGYDAAEGMGLVPEGSSAVYTQAELDRREQYEKLPVSITSIGKGVTFAGEAVPYMAFPAAKFGTWGNILYGMGVGGATSGTQFVEPGEERLHKLFQGMLLAGGVQGSLELYTKLPSWYARRVLSKSANQIEYKEGDKIIDSIRKGGGEKFDLNIEQMTSLPTAVTTRKAMELDPNIADRMWAHQNTSSKAFTKFYIKQLNKYKFGKVKPEELTASLKTNYNSFVDKAKTDRRTQWNLDMSEVDKRLGGKRRVSLASTLNTAKEELAKLTQRGVVKDPGTLKQINQLVDDISPRDITGRFTGNDKVTAKHLQGMLSSWGEEAKPLKSIAQTVEKAKLNVVAKRIFKSLNDDLAIAAENKGLGEAAVALQLARKNYATNSTAIKRVTSSSLGKLFDKPIEELTVSTVTKNIKKFNAREISYATDLFDQIDPKIMHDVRSYVLRDALKESLVESTAPGVNKINFKKLSKSMPAPAEMRALLTNEHGRLEFLTSLKAMNRLVNSMEVKSSGQLAEKAQAAVHNIAERNPGFTLRLMAKLGLPKTLEKLATTEGRQALIAASQTKSQTEFIAAMAVLLDDVDVKEGAQQLVDIGNARQ